MWDQGVNTWHGYFDQDFSGIYDAQSRFKLTPAKKITTVYDRKLSYRFYPHFHPYTDELIKRLNERSVSGLQSTDTEYKKDTNGEYITLPGSGNPRPNLYEEIFSETNYKPNKEVVDSRYPVKELDFSTDGSYSVYNWELFFHIPFTIALHLSKNQRYADSQKWFHYLFDPTDNSDGPTPERFWKVKPFQKSDIKMIEEMLVNLSTNEDKELHASTIASLNKLKDKPFRPHVVARNRHPAYMLKTVMAYLDNLIDWGDSLFRQDTGESINEAMQLYVLAANILGSRPQPVPKKGSVRTQTYASLRADLNELGNALTEFETDITFNIAPHPTKPGDNAQLNTLQSIGSSLYFCVPRNDKMLSYWGKVADRLFKIRNSLNIHGIFRQLPLFEPPIDPALLARAAASGLDIGAVVSGVNQPLPLVRFQVLIQKALEICQEVKSLGNNLLSTIEKEDNEKMALLRAKQESLILGMTETVRYAQLQESIKSREGLEISLNNAALRHIYYERLLGKKQSEIEMPGLEDLDETGLENGKAKISESSLTPREVKINIASGPIADAASALVGGKQLSSHEVREQILLEAGQLAQEVAALVEALGTTTSQIPQTTLNVEPFGTGVSVSYGGEQISKVPSIAASIARAISGRLSFEANRAARIGSFDRREQEWAFQSNQALGEINQILKQLRASQIREYIAQKELENHQQQIINAEEIEQFLTDERRGKKANKDFYTWMKREVKGLYNQSFQFAFDVAKKAERALQHELGEPDLSFIKFGYLAGKEGLLAGEKLCLDCKRMDMAFLDLNKREYELTKHISLKQLDPLSILQLRETGRCTVNLSEELFDMDCPGNYFRRIKSVALTIPCITGPYTSVNCKLTLTRSSIRKNSLLSDVSDGGYIRENAEDNRFSDYFGSLQSVVTSSAQSDSGIFDGGGQDGRYIPFECSGVDSQWQLELPANPSKKDEAPQFDYNTISDVILHIQYTAREGGEVLKKAAKENIQKQVKYLESNKPTQLFSVRHDFPDEWARFKNSENQNNETELKLNLTEEHYPFWSRKGLKGVQGIELFARSTKINVSSIRISDNDLVKAPSFGDLLQGKLDELPDEPVGQVTLEAIPKDVGDLWFALTWGSG